MKLYIALTPEQMKADGWSKVQQLVKIALEDESEVKISSDGYCTIIEAKDVIDGNHYEYVDVGNNEAVGVWRETEDGSVFEPK